MYNLIMLPCVVLILLTTYYQMKSATKPRRNIVFGVTLPSDVLNDSRVLGMINGYKHSINKCFIINVITSIPIFLISKTSINIIYMLTWSIVVCSYGVNYPYKTMNKRLKKLKEDNNWYIGEKKVVNIDTKLSKLKNKMPISDKYMIIPILISILPISISIPRADSDFKYIVGMSILNTLIVVSLYVFGFRSIKKARLKVYSKNSDINYAINKEEKYLNSIMWFLIALSESLIYLVVYLLIFEIINLSYEIIPIIAISTSCILSFVFNYINKRIRDVEEELTKADTQTIYTDDDEFWIDGYKYYNENDKSNTVNARYGNSYTYNLANKKGKFATYGVGIVVTLIIVPIMLNMVAMDFSKPEITIDEKEGIVSVDYPSYDYSFDIKDIEEIKLVEDVKFKMRINGISTDGYSRGTYKSEEYGKCRAYVYDKSSPYIVVKLKNTYFIYNEENKENTMVIYDKLNSKINNDSM